MALIRTAVMVSVDSERLTISCLWWRQTLQSPECHLLDCPQTPDLLANCPCLLHEPSPRDKNLGCAISV